jgi:Tfp pilus assembly protein PilO
MRQQYLILLAVMIVISILFFHYSSVIITQKINNIDKYDKRIKIEQEKLNSAKVLNEQLRDVSRVIIGSISSERKFDADEIGLFTKSLYDMAEKYKFAVHSYSHKDISSLSGSFVEHLYSMELNCTFVQLGKFLTELEALDQIIKIKTLDVVPNASKGNKEVLLDGQETRYKVTIELSTIKIVKEA